MKVPILRHRPNKGEEVLGIPRMKPMLASTVSCPFRDGDWFFELKWDGYRCLAYITAKDGLYLDSRNGKPLLPEYPVLLGMAGALKCDSVLLDGEIIALNGGKVDFSLIRRRGAQVVFVAFDVLWIDGRLTTNIPLHERKELLKGALSWGREAVLSEVVETDGESLFSWAKERDMEGIMAKRKNSIYLPGERTTDWLKIKNLREGVFWVVGYAHSPGRRIGSLVIAEKDGEEFRPAGRVGSGIDAEFEAILVERLQPLNASSSNVFVPHFSSLPSELRSKDIIWVNPYYGVEVSFTEMTPDGSLRHPVLKEVTVEDAR